MGSSALAVEVIDPQGRQLVALRDAEGGVRVVAREEVRTAPCCGAFRVRSRCTSER